MVTRFGYRYERRVFESNIKFDILVKGKRLDECVVGKAFNIPNRFTTILKSKNFFKTFIGLDLWPKSHLMLNNDKYVLSDKILSPSNFRCNCILTVALEILCELRQNGQTHMV